jgi:hypothetical protein
MKKDDAPTEDDDLRAEYDSSMLKGGIRGKYLDRYRSGTNLALLAPDTRAAFPTDKAVNEALRSVMRRFAKDPHS